MPYLYNILNINPLMFAAVESSMSIVVIYFRLKYERETFEDRLIDLNILIHLYFKYVVKSFSISKLFLKDSKLQTTISRVTLKHQWIEIIFGVLTSILVQADEALSG